MTIDVEDVCTHEQLADELGGEDGPGLARLEELLGQSGATGSAGFRQRALDDVLKALRRRTPPIFERHISDVTELRDAVRYGALARVYMEAMTSPEDVHGVRWKDFRARYTDEVRTLTPTLPDTGTAHGLSLSVERR